MATLLLVSACVSSSAFAATFTSSPTGGDWALGATWGNPGNNVEGSGYPGADDDAILALQSMSYSVVLSADQRVRNLTVNPDLGNSYFRSLQTGTHTLDIYGTVDTATIPDGQAAINPLWGNFRFGGSSSREMFGPKWGVGLSQMVISVALDSPAVLTLSRNLRLANVTLTSGGLDLAVPEELTHGLMTVNGGVLRTIHGGKFVSLTINDGRVETYEDFYADTLTMGPLGYLKIYSVDPFNLYAGSCVLHPQSTVEYCPAEAGWIMAFSDVTYGKVLFSGAGATDIGAFAAATEARVQSGSALLLEGKPVTGDGSFVLEDDSYIRFGYGIVPADIQMATESFSENATYHFSGASQVDQPLTGLPPSVDALYLDGSFDWFAMYALDAPLTVKKRFWMDGVVLNLQGHMLTLGTPEQEVAFERTSYSGAYNLCWLHGGPTRVMIKEGVSGPREFPMLYIDEPTLIPELTTSELIIDFKTPSATPGSITIERKEQVAPGLSNPNYALDEHWVLQYEGLSGFVADVKHRAQPLPSAHKTQMSRAQVRLAQNEGGPWTVHPGTEDAQGWFTWPGFTPTGMFALLQPQALGLAGVEDWEQR